MKTGPEIKIRARIISGILKAASRFGRQAEICSVKVRIEPDVFPSDISITTEILGDFLLSKAEYLSGKNVAEVGTGCGILSFVAARFCARVTATDVSLRAVCNAIENSRALGLDHKVRFRKTDVLDGIDETFDVIVVNPPYLMIEARDGFDLTNREAGFSAKFFRQSAVRLAPGGKIFAAYSDAGDMDFFLREAARHGFSWEPCARRSMIFENFVIFGFSRNEPRI